MIRSRRKPNGRSHGRRTSQPLPYHRSRMTPMPSWNLTRSMFRSEELRETQHIMAEFGARRGGLPAPAGRHRVLAFRNSPEPGGRSNALASRSLSPARFTIASAVAHHGVGEPPVKGNAEPAVLHERGTKPCRKLA